MITMKTVCCYAKVPLFLGDNSTNFSVTLWAKLVSGGLRGVRAADMEDIKYLFTRGVDSTERGKGLSAIPTSKSGPALAASALVSKRFVVYLASFLDVSFYLETGSPKLSTSHTCMAKTSKHRHCGRQSVWAVPTGDEESREDEDDALDSKDGGVEYEDVAHL